MSKRQDAVKHKWVLRNTHTLGLIRRINFAWVYIGVTWYARCQIGSTMLIDTLIAARDIGRLNVILGVLAQGHPHACMALVGPLASGGRAATA
jgi:hypothetical protein